MPDVAIGFGDFPAWIALVISIGSAIRQWFVNNDAQKERTTFEARSLVKRQDFQKKLRIDELTKDIEELRALSLDYWTRPGLDTGSAGLMINVKTKDISSRVWAYSNFLWPEVASDFFALKRLITGGAFQSLSRDALAHDSELIQELLNAFSGFRDSLRTESDKIDIS